MNFSLRYVMFSPDSFCFSLGEPNGRLNNSMFSCQTRSFDDGQAVSIGAHGVDCSRSWAWNWMLSAEPFRSERTR